MRYGTARRINGSSCDRRPPPTLGPIGAPLLFPPGAARRHSPWIATPAPEWPIRVRAPRAQPLSAQDRHRRYRGMPAATTSSATQPNDLRCDIAVAMKPFEDLACRHVHAPTADACNPHVGAIGRPFTERFVRCLDRRPFAHSGDTSSYRPALRSWRTIPLNAAVTPWALPISFVWDAASQ